MPFATPANTRSTQSEKFHLRTSLADVPVNSSSKPTTQIDNLPTKTFDAPNDYIPEWIEEEHYEPPPEDVIRSLVRCKYHAFLDIFSKEKGESLPLHTDFDLQINLFPDKPIPFGGIYRLATAESATLKTYIDEMLEKGLIRPSTSRAGSPVLFVPKKGGELRLCVDYRRLNAITLKDRYPIPSTDILLDQLSSAKIFTKMDLQWAYPRVRIAEGHEWKTAFRTRWGLFEYLVMPFGLTNAPGCFQRCVQTVLREFLDIFCIVYIDNILIHFNNQEEHDAHVLQVMQALDKANLFAKASKCDFDVYEVEYLGYKISPDGIFLDPKKVETIIEWIAPSTPTQLRGFLGFANFYRRFIHAYSKLAKPLYELLKKKRTIHVDR